MVRTNEKGAKYMREEKKLDDKKGMYIRLAKSLVRSYKISIVKGGKGQEEKVGKRVGSEQG